MPQEPTTGSRFIAPPRTAPLSLGPVSLDTPMGGQVLPTGKGSTFKVWAPRAQAVDLICDYYRGAGGAWVPGRRSPLQRIGRGRWGGFDPDMKHGDRYMFHVIGPEGGTEGPKRDPYARDLSDEPMWPESQCLLYDPARFPWHDEAWRPPPHHELRIYQLHVGTWYVPMGRSKGSFLDVALRLPYLKALGINAVQLLPIVEFPTQFSLGYNGVDYFSPETDYGIFRDDPELSVYLQGINENMARIDPRLTPYALDDIQGTAAQFRLMVDQCHVHGIAVLLDVVYNHAGGDFGDRSLYHFDRMPYGDHNDSLYFTDIGHAGGLVFAYWNADVRQFLIDNAVYFLKECHCDGFRYDQVSVINHDGGAAGWLFCQHVTDTCRFAKPEAIHIAEHWPVENALVTPTASGGAGFDACQSDGLREAVRAAVLQAAAGRGSRVDMDRVARELSESRLSDPWRATQMCEDHDIVRSGRGERIPRLADGLDTRSWFARSRTRVALGLVSASAGLPHLFMGQEILEDKQWSDDPGSSAHRIWWEGLEIDKAMVDFLRFTRELMSLRARLPALSSTGCRVFHVHNDNRVLAMHRWVPGRGQDVLVVFSLNEGTFRDYRLGFPRPGFWKEAFNSDVYDNWVNPWTAGNGGGVHADDEGMHGFGHSAAIVIPANGFVILEV